MKSVDATLSVAILQRRTTKNLSISLCILTILNLFVVASSGPAAVVEGIKFGDRYTVEEKSLRLTGVGLLRYWGFKAYTGALYLEEGVSVDDVLSDSAKRIELEYFRAIKGEDFGPATDKSIAANVDPQTFDRLRSRIAYHNSLYEDVRPGDRYSLTYIPGKGTDIGTQAIRCDARYYDAQHRWMDGSFGTEI